MDDVIFINAGATWLELGCREATIQWRSDVDPDTDRVGTASFCRIRIGIKGMPIQIRPIQIGINSKLCGICIFTFIQNISICCPNT
jgi:hypothetical protein